MRDIVNRALEQATDTGQEAVTDRTFGDPRIVAIGCGEGGTKALNHIRGQCNEVETIALSTTESEAADFAYPVSFPAPMPDTGADSIDSFVPADSPTDELADVLQRTDLCFVLADLSEHTALPAAATAITVAERLDPMSVGLLILRRGGSRANAAETPGNWYHELLHRPTSAGLIDAATVAEKNGTDIEQAHVRSGAIHAQTVVNLATTLIEPSLINIDYADITTTLHAGSVFTLLETELPSEQDPDLSLESDWDFLQPLYPIELADISSCWTHITAGPGITPRTAEQLASDVAARIADESDDELLTANVWGCRIVDHSALRLQVVCGGVEPKRMPQLIIEG
jgi:cell division protein FtsZ